MIWFGVVEVGRYLDNLIKTTYCGYVAKRLGSEKIKQGISLRKQGFSFGEISELLAISKSTASLLFRSVSLSGKARKRIEQLQIEARIKGLTSVRNKIEQRKREIENNVKRSLRKLKLDDPLLAKVFCALLYWGEGSKTGYRVAFISSDPLMVVTFLTLLRAAFPLKESKLRALVHVHEYHNEPEVKRYWSELTRIPLSQFTKSYLKPHTKRVIREGYKGALRVSYHDVKIVNELKAIYNTFARNIGV